MLPISSDKVRFYVYNRSTDMRKSFDGLMGLVQNQMNLQPTGGDVVDGKMVLNAAAKFVQKCWMEIPVNYPNVTLDKFVIMPNHMHGIIMVVGNDESVGAIHELPLRNTPLQRRKMTLPKIMGRFKMNIAKNINKMRNSPGVPVWQLNFWEHIIRDDHDLNRIREYIDNNPLQWELDNENRKHEK